MKIEIIPAIDLIGGKCVRLTQGDYSQKTIYYENPLFVARMFEDSGIKRLHLVDLDGAKSKHIVNQRVLEQIANNTNLIIDFGGGLKSNQDLEIAFQSGASMITAGSVAVQTPSLVEEWLGKYGSEKIILGADAKGDQISVSGWTENSGENIYNFIQKWEQKGIRKVISTDISRDGMLQGTANQLYVSIMERIPGLYLIASGGVSSMKDILDLESAGIPAVIVGKAIYEGRISLQEISNFYNS